MKVVALVPAACELMQALGLTHLLVGHSHVHCMLGCKGIVPVCTEPRCGKELEMARVDLRKASVAFKALLWEATYGLASRSVSFVEWALAPYRVFPHMLCSLKPDVILTQICEYQVLEKEEVIDAVHELLDPNVYLINIDPKRLDDLWKDITLVAKVLGKHTEGQQVIDNLKARLGLVNKFCKGRQKKRVLLWEWDDIMYLPNTMASEIVNVVGGINVDAVIGSKCKNFNWDSLRAMDTEVVIILGTLGHSLEEAFQEILCSAKEGLPTSSTYLCPHLFVVSSIALSSRSGPGIVELLEILTEILHPESQPFGHFNVLWRRLELI